uniref:Uncharacterized protein n=1 Tax=Romanomermis culicivorax TaxID=13658 RepID=A0A915J367_ROMCU
MAGSEIAGAEMASAKMTHPGRYNLLTLTECATPCGPADTPRLLARILANAFSAESARSINFCLVGIWVVWHGPVERAAWAGRYTDILKTFLELQLFLFHFHPIAVDQSVLHPIVVHHLSDGRSFGIIQSCLNFL